MRRRYLRIALWSVGVLLVALGVVWLAASLLQHTTLNVDPGARSAATQTAVGGLECRKTLTPRFPFVALTCAQDR